MEPLDKQENKILQLLCTDPVALEDFLIESENPRFLPFLNGENANNLNIFKDGFASKALQWTEHSCFWLPAIYLEKIANRLHQEANVTDSIRQEYFSLIDRALRDLIHGYAKEAKRDPVVVQSLLHIIQTKNIESLDAELFHFMIENLEVCDSSIVIRNILPIIKEMMTQKQHVPHIEQFVELMIGLLPDKYVASDDRAYFIGEFLLNKEIIGKLTDICRDSFLSNLADKLTQTLGQEKEISIQDEIEIKIQADCSLQIKISDTAIQFTLPYVEFRDKEQIIAPSIEKNLQAYNGDNKNSLCKKILYWYTYVWSDLTYISYPSLYSESIGYYKYRQRILIYLLKEILLVRLKTQGLEKFLDTYQVITSKSKYFIFKRMFLYCFGKEFEKTRDRLFALIEQEKYLLLSLYFEAEMYGLLEKNADKFTPIEQNKIEEIIENGPYFERVWDQSSKSEEISIKGKNLWKQEWYAPLHEIEHFKHKYEELRKQTQMKEFFNFRDGTTARVVHYNALLEDMEVLSLLENNPVLYITKITQFAKNQPNRVEASMYEVPHSQGNVEQLQRLADNYPAIVTESITELAELSPVYIRHILYGLHTTKDRKNIKWDKLCSFIENYVDNLSQSKQGLLVKTNNTDDIIDVPKGKEMESVISAWADIISIQEDGSFFNISEIQRLLLKYLKLLLQNYAFDYQSIYYLKDGEKYPADYLTLTINSAIGRVLEKLIRVILSKNVCNLAVLKDIYGEMLKNKVVEAHVFLGLYFIFFYQNLGEWTKEQTNRLLSLSSNQETCQYWEMFFEGFIKSNNQYLDYYEWMHEHYKKAIELYNKMGLERLTEILTQFFEKDRDILDSNSLIRFCWEKKAFLLLSGCVQEISFPLNKGKLYGYTPNEADIEQEKQFLPKAEKLWNFLWDQIGHEHNILLSESPAAQKDLFVNMLELIPALPSLSNSTTGRISQLIDCIELKILGTSNVFGNLLYIVEKKNRGKNEILNLAKLYCKLIQKMDYFIITEQHFKIIALLKEYTNTSEIKEQLYLIQTVYITKKWNQYLNWFK